MKKTLALCVTILWLHIGAIDCDNSTSAAPQHPKPDVYQLHVITDIKYRYATTVVTSRVANPADVAQEVSFTVVLPETAFISGFLMEIKDKVYEAYIKEKEEAKKDYNAAVSQGLGAGYVEQKARDSNQFTVSVNVEPHSKVNFNLTYDQLLARTLGTYKHVVNINPGQIVRDLSVVVHINESSKISKVEVPELQLDNEVAADLEKKQNSLAVVTQPNPHSADIRWAPTPEQQTVIAKNGINGQLTVEYNVDRDNSQEILVEDGYFVHFFAPETLKPLPKHVVFVLDYSGSMLGKKIEQLKEAMATILSDLSPADYFSLVLFSNIAQAWSPVANINTTTTPTPTTFHYNDYSAGGQEQELIKDHIVPATPDKISLAKDHINTFNDYGGTNIIAALRNGLKLALLGKEVLKNKAQQPEPMIVFLTDGQPNVELYDTEEIIKKVKELNTLNVTIFSLAFGYEADTKFLKKLSFGNNGFHRVIYEAADAASQLKNFYRQIASPLLSDIKFNYVPDQVDEDTATKVDFPTFFNGSEIVVAGKLQSQEPASGSKKSGELVAKGADGVTKYPIVIDYILIHPHPEVKKNRSISRLEKVWAYLTIQQLLDKADTLSDEKEVNATRTKALNLALTYKFVTPLTSLVVVKPNATTNVDAEKVQPGLDKVQSLSGIHGPSQIFVGYPSAPPQHPGPMGAGFASGGYLQQSFYQPPPAQRLPSFPSTTTSVGLSEPESLDVLGPNEEDTSDKGTLEDLPWLYTYTKDNITFTLPLSDGPADFIIGRNEMDTVHGPCITPSGKAGECHHLEHCVLSAFYVGFDQFLPYRCNIKTSVSSYLGACCPVNTNSTLSAPVLPTSATEIGQPASSS